jgi:hypothetical protein
MRSSWGRPGAAPRTTQVAVDLATTVQTVNAEADLYAGAS